MKEKNKNIVISRRPRSFPSALNSWPLIIPLLRFLNVHVVAAVCAMSDRYLSSLYRKSSSLLCGANDERVVLEKLRKMEAHSVGEVGCKRLDATASECIVARAPFANVNILLFFVVEHRPSQQRTRTNSTGETKTNVKMNKPKPNKNNTKISQNKKSNERIDLISLSISTFL